MRVTHSSLTFWTGTAGTSTAAGRCRRWRSTRSPGSPSRSGTSSPTRRSKTPGALCSGGRKGTYAAGFARLWRAQPRMTSLPVAQGDAHRSEEPQAWRAPAGRCRAAKGTTANLWANVLFVFVEAPCGGWEADSSFSRRGQVQGSAHGRIRSTVPPQRIRNPARHGIAVGTHGRSRQAGIQRGSCGGQSSKGRSNQGQGQVARAGTVKGREE